MNNAPDLSILTVTFRDPEGLARTLESVASQAAHPLRVEHIVVDGGSGATVEEMLRTWADRGEDRHWISEADDGIYDAMNKAWRMATGHWLLFLNGGDTLRDAGVLRCLAPELAPPAPEPIVSGRVEYAVGGKGSGLLRPITPGPEGLGLPHQATFVARELQVAFPFDPSLAGAGDLDLWLRLRRAGRFKVRYLDTVVALFEVGGISNGPGRERARIEERIVVLRRHGYPTPGLLRTLSTTVLRSTLRHLLGEERFLRLLRLRARLRLLR